MRCRYSLPTLTRLEFVIPPTCRRRNHAHPGSLFYRSPPAGTVDDEARAKYREELERNPTLVKARDGYRIKREMGDAAFHDWVATKEAGELALECMQLLPVVLDFDQHAAAAARPAASDGEGGSIGGTPQKSSVGSMPSSIGPSTYVAGLDKPLLNRPPSEDEYELWRAVGYACKAIDRALLVPWVTWSAPLFAKGDCLREWAGFKPINHGKEEDSDDNEGGAHARGRSAERSSSMQESKSKSPSKHLRNHSSSGATSTALVAVKPPRVEKWTAEDRTAALHLLRQLSQEHRRLALFRAEAAAEAPPAVPVLRRQPAAEALPAFLHGHEGSVRRVQSDLALADGMGCGMLGGSGVGCELVMQWFVGEDDLQGGPALGVQAVQAMKQQQPGGGTEAPKQSSSSPESPERLMQRLNQAHDKVHGGTGAAAAGDAKSSASAPASYSGRPRRPVQPPYVVVLETCGVAGGRKAREGEWTRVLIDPPEPLPILSSAPGSTLVPVSARAQGLGILPPSPGETNQAWEENAQRLRGCVRLTGLMPNTTYCYRVRAYSRMGASAYAFGAFTTAAAPPPAPIIALPFLTPRSLLSGAALGPGGDPVTPGSAKPAGAPSPPTSTDLMRTPVQPDAVTIVWERRVDFRVHLLRLLRAFYACIVSAGKQQHGGDGARGSKGRGFSAASSSAAAGRDRRTTGDDDADGPVEDFVVDDDDHDGFSVGDDTQHDDDHNGGGRTNGKRRGGRSHNADDGVRVDVDDDANGHHQHAAGGVFSSIRCSRQALLAQVNREVGLRNWLASCVASPDHWPSKEGEDEGAGDDDGGAEGRNNTSSASSFRRLPDRFRIGTTRPATVLEALLTDVRESLTWGDLTVLFADDAEADDPLDLMLAGTPLSVQATPASPQPVLAKRPVWSSQSGELSQTSRRAAMLKRSQTLSKLKSSSGSSANLLATASPSAASIMGAGFGHGNTMMMNSTAGVPRPLPTPLPAAHMAGTGGNVTRMLNGLSAGRRGSQVSTMMTAASPMVLKVSGATSDVGVRYSLLQCVSDGPRGQEWSELYLGTRSMRRVDKLLPGTAYTFKVQAVNGDGQGSLFGPAAYITTGLPAPQRLRTTGRLNATSVNVAWDAVSAANALNTMRAISMGSADTGGDGDDGKEGKPKGGDPSAAADIDAVLQALLAKGKAASEKAKKQGKGAAGGKKTFVPATALVPIREGDGGVGVDLSRCWDRYDVDGVGYIPSSSLRGLLTDLGAYAETNALVTGASDPASSGGASAASSEGAASAGPGEWRLHAAIKCLDPSATGRIRFADFSDWWNSVDAALEKALAVKSSAATMTSRSRPQSARTQTTGRGNDDAGLDATVIGSPVATVAKLTSAVVYILECRRVMTKQEVDTARGIAAATSLSSPLNASLGGAASVAGGGTATSRSVMSRSGSATMRTALNTPASVAGDMAIGGLASTSSPRPGSASPIAYTPWTVVYMGASTHHRVTDLLPNGHYQFRVSVVGRHAYSSPSSVLACILPPLAPFAPVVIKTNPRSAALRWYPGELSADKFEVQVLLVETLLPNGVTVHGETTKLMAGAVTGRGTDHTSSAGRLYTGRNVSESTKRRLATSRALVAAGTTAEDGGMGKEDVELWREMVDGDGWVSLYTGTSSFTVLTGLFANTVYRVRVIAYNASGVASRPSVETQMITIDNTQYEPLTIANAGRHFVVECGAAAAAAPSAPGASPNLVQLPAQDIVVGDVILFTEDVFVDRAPDVDMYHPQPKKEVPEGHPRAHFLCSRTIAATVIGDSASCMVAGGGHSANVGAPDGPVPVGFAAVAATAHAKSKAIDKDADTGIVVSKAGSLLGFTSGQKAPGTTMRAKSGNAAATDSGKVATTAMRPPISVDEAVARRQLSLQVEWCTVSAAKAAYYVLPHGAIVKRSQADIAHLDVYRCMWEDEAGRWGLGEELTASYDR